VPKARVFALASLSTLGYFKLGLSFPLWRALCYILGRYFSMQIVALAESVLKGQMH
jgi:hypothetical protein